MKLLVYTDNVFFLAMLEGSLKKAGTDSVCATALEQALQLAENDTWGALIDLHATGSFELIEALAARVKPVAAFCGHAETGIRQKAKTAGVQLLLSNSDLAGNLPRAIQALQAKSSHPNLLCASGDTA